MNECEFQSLPDGRVRCSRCGHEKARISRRKCNVQPFLPGDALEALLKKFGLTCQVYQQYRDQIITHFKLEPPAGVGCQQRKVWLNEQWDRLKKLLGSE